MTSIVTNQSAVTAYNNYSRTNTALSRTTERLSSGLRINRAAEDAAGLAISESFRLQIKGVSGAQSNIDNALNFLNTADGYLQNIADIMGRMEELAVEYGDATKSDPEGNGDSGDLAAVNTEFRQLVSELNAVVGTGEDDATNNARARYNGVPIFTAAGRDFQIGPDAGEIFRVEEDALDLVNGNDFGNFQDLLNFDTDTGVLEAGDPEDATVGTIAVVQAASDEISSFRALLGSYQSRLQFGQTGLGNYGENISAAESRIRNADLALESTNFARRQILTQAGLAMIAQANTMPQNVLQLLNQQG